MTPTERLDLIRQLNVTWTATDAELHSRAADGDDLTLIVGELLGHTAARADLLRHLTLSDPMSVPQFPDGWTVELGADRIVAYRTPEDTE